MIYQYIGESHMNPRILKASVIMVTALLPLIVHDSAIKLWYNHKWMLTVPRDSPCKAYSLQDKFNLEEQTHVSWNTNTWLSLLSKYMC